MAVEWEIQLDVLLARAMELEQELVWVHAREELALAMVMVKAKAVVENRLSVVERK